MKETTNKFDIDQMAKDCIAMRLRLINRVVTKLYDEALRPLGLKVSQMNILVIAAKLGHVHPSDACKILQMDPSTLSRNVERMRVKGLLEKVQEKDARAHSFRITSHGYKLVEKAFPGWLAVQTKARKILGKEGEEVLMNIADDILSQALRV